MSAVVLDWFAPLSLIFGGCCSNALTLEQLTSQYPDSGHLITFAQFLLVSLRGLPNLLEITYPNKNHGLLPMIHVKRPRIPLRAYIIQVILFLFVSILNNMAFAYKIPMPVHIIFRSGGLVISMCLGWLVMGRRYTLTQVISVLLVTAGVILTTYSASQTKTKPKYASTTSTTSAPHRDTLTYLTGIGILSLALLCSGFLGLAQDKMYSTYTRYPVTVSAQRDSSGKNEGKSQNPGSKPQSEKPQWQESMFYLHFLAMPMFWFVRQDLGVQLASVTSGPRVQVNLNPAFVYSNFIVLPNSTMSSPPAQPQPTSPASLSVPVGLLALILTTVTSLICISGVHRLTARVASLTVTLVLTVRKAVSLIISVLFFPKAGEQGDTKMMWVGAALVGLGTVGYAMGGAGGRQKQKQKKD
ncbi:UAA transporter [Neolentinus lepideus HHB14362 ss-1]|uniref:UAA transporter n=1 Tax=Neolentinus lepideus HHB14362 ss-1 TaxID=1314782 RepID=A0A165TRN3_9AGAM|nr:UAA transporter [Neolentinus lepideus HHB14362 ss-1]